jgi:PAS domain S-box-containing protein
MMIHRDNKLTRLPRLKPVLWFAAAVVVFATLAMLVVWRAPSLEWQARDWLMRTRGTLPAPEDIAIVAIDEASLKRFGRFPWPRSLMARALDRVREAEPRAVALDVLYSDRTNAGEDAALAAAIERAGKVVVATELASAEDERAVWIEPLPEIARVAAGVGHTSVHTGPDGLARTLLLRAADDAGRSRWAMAVELLRAGEGLEAEAVRERPDAVLIGNREIPTIAEAHDLEVESDGPPVARTTAARMPMDFIGPAGSFAARTVSIGELMDGRVAAERLRGKYVLIGATAATLGDRIASPMIHTLVGNRTRSELMPGVEVLANQLSTILRERFYREPPDWLVFLCAALVAAAVSLSAALGGGLVRQLAALALLAAAIVAGSVLAFSRWMWVAPLAPMLASFLIATPLVWLRRSFVLSREIDDRIAELDEAGKRVLPAASETNGLRRGLGRLWPRDSAAKARELQVLHRLMLERASFVDRALRSVEDGLIVADAEANIRFANPRAAEILGVAERALVGGNLFERIAEAESLSALQGQTLVSRLQSAEAARAQLRRLLDERKSLEREITLNAAPGNPRQYTLRLSTVRETADGEILGIVASFTDITRHRELERTQRDVMALVTHELKTPLTAIQGMSELLARYEPSEAQRRDMHLSIHDEAKRLARMIDEYLDLTRLESGARPLRLAPLRIETLVERALRMLDPVAQQRGIRLVRQFGPALPAILGDADLIARAVTNLADNAIKYSPANSAVTINVRSDDAAIEIAVADEGGGIATEFLPRIFEKFYRVPRAGDVDVPGTGLGLALVREVAELHGGRVTVDSRPEAGSVFSLILPFCGRT